MAFTAKNKMETQVLEIVATADETGNTVAVTAVNFYRTRAKYIDGKGFSVPYSGGAAAATCEVELGLVPPPPSTIVLKTSGWV